LQSFCCHLFIKAHIRISVKDLQSQKQLARVPFTRSERHAKTQETGNASRIDFGSRKSRIPAHPRCRAIPSIRDSYSFEPPAASRRPVAGGAGSWVGERPPRAEDVVSERHDVLLQGGVDAV